MKQNVSCKYLVILFLREYDFGSMKSYMLMIYGR